jgi:tRNA A-37 threonylcarbamoyl transferase component Bud32
MGGDPDVYRITIMKPRSGAASVDDLVGRLLPSLTLHQYVQTATVTAGDTSILKGRSCIAPFYFAGWDSALSIFVICSSDLSRVPEFGLDEYVSKTSPAHPRIILAAATTLKTLLYLGVTVTRDIKKSMYLTTKGSTVHARIKDAVDLVHLPISIHTHAMRSIDAGISPIQAWYDAGGPEWLGTLHRGMVTPKTLADPFVMLQTMATKTLQKHRQSSPGGQQKKKVKIDYATRLAKSNLFGNIASLIPSLNDSSKTPSRSFPAFISPATNVNTFIKNTVTNPVLSFDPNFRATPEFIMSRVMLTSKGKIGEGEYGSVYMIDISSQRRNFAALYRLLHNTQLNKAPSSKTTCVMLKFERLPKEDRRKRLAKAVNEAKLMKIAANGSIKVKGKVLDGATFVPPMYFSGTYLNYHIICMGYAKGQTLFDVLTAQGSISMPVFRALERALQYLLRIGIVHSDLHADNVIISGSTTSSPVAKIIDFGMAYQLPKRLHTKAVGILDRTGSLQRAWDDSGLTDHMDSYWAGVYPYYHSNIKMLRYALTLVRGVNKNGRAATPVSI